MARKRIKRKGDSYLRDGLILLAVAVVFAVILGGVFFKTKKPIDNASEAAKLAGYENVFTGYEGIRFESNEEYDEKIAAYNKTINDEYRTAINDMADVYDDNGACIGYAFIVKSKGYEDDITLSVGIDTEGAITGIDIVSMNETAGLGANCTDEGFKNQFKGKSEPIDVDAGDVDALTGATMTTKGVARAVNACIEFYAQMGN